MTHPRPSPSLAPSSRTRVRRLPDRAHYDFDTVAAVVDASRLCTIAFAWNGSVHALPTAHWRDGDHLYIHGARASRMLQALVQDECCVSVARVDGLVFARSAFHHSMNYRSAVIYGRFEAVEDAAAKEAALRAFIERLAPGRWTQLRPVSAKEVHATTVLRLPLAEASVKIRDWGVKDDAEDMDWPVWAGVVPLDVVTGPPQTDPASVVGAAPAVPA
ncbi:pyridoxamine 5'-phosphate oxidase family protein [Pseudothauera rhizosphaerae]|uniref:Pyridoxamine 5'-phosphate oxidase family protein n=1 Tax=Pseudothauera rhizosphaerae TaxID=2565932 RepID=A0A4S4ALA9_9RHOO|nr:pyridoxamine 5'-phosphate oxidase family protein [Pseudothauera rhizosphaerae]THF60191.1 pyridoxamine 5'-phosphate oxidase family protein [Pseudothauera rhizosphaerae]